MSIAISPLFKKYRGQAGLSLIELLVALALGVVLVGGITRVYLENKRNYVKDEEVARLQENGRFVLNIIKREIKMAGMYASTELTPVADAVTAITNDCVAGWALNPAQSVDFFDKPTSLAASATGVSFAGCVSASSDLQSGSDILAVKRTAGAAAIDNGVYGAGITSSNAKLDTFYVKRTGRETVALSYVSSSGFPSDVTAVTTDPFSQVSMWLYKAKIFYVRNYSVVAGDNIPTLMMTFLQGKAMIETALVEGVEALHIEWGIPDPTAGIQTPVQYVSDPTSAQIQSATVARIYLLMRTRNPSRDYTDTKTYKLGSMPAITPGGNYSRRVFTSTVKIRN